MVIERYKKQFHLVKLELKNFNGQFGACVPYNAT